MRVIRMAEKILIEMMSHNVHFSTQDYIWILGEKTKSELMSLCDTFLDGQPLMNKLLGIEISNDKLHEPYGICLVPKRSYMREEANMEKPKVNIYDAERKFEEYVEQAIEDNYIKKPIAWALYQTWKWANFNEKEREVNKGVLSQINEKQDSLKSTCKAWDEAIKKNGYVN